MAWGGSRNWVQQPQQSPWRQLGWGICHKAAAYSAGCCNLDCTTVDEVVDLAVAAGTPSLAKAIWEMLGGLNVVDGYAKHGDW